MDRAYPCDHAFIEEVFTKIFPQKGHNVFLVMRTGSYIDTPVIHWNNAEILLFKGGKYKTVMSSLRNVLGFICVAKKILQIKQSKNINLLFVRNDPIMGIFAILLSVFMNLPFVFQLSHLKEESFLVFGKAGLMPDPFFSRTKGMLGILLRHYVLKKSHLVLPVSKIMKEYLAKKGVLKSKMITIPLAANIHSTNNINNARNHIRSEFGLNSESNILIYIGTMSRGRGLQIIIEAFEKVRNINHNAFLLMIGGDENPGDIDFLKTIVKNKNLIEHVCFTGLIPRKKTSEYVQGSDLGLSPFPPYGVLTMNSPMKLFEYLGCGIPVIGTDIPEQRKIINESGGGIITNYDIGQFSEAIINMLEKDPSERRAMGKRGQDYIEKNRTYAILANKLEQILISIVQKNARWKINFNKNGKKFGT